MSKLTETIGRNIDAVTERIAAARSRAGRSDQPVRLVAVVKYARPQWIEALIHSGVRDLGESRPQQLLERAGQFERSVRWHLVGHLQRNKTKKVLPVAWMIQSVDSFRLLKTLERLCAQMHRRPRVLLEVNVSGEEAKHGFAADELRQRWDDVLACRHLDFEGLMTMAPLSGDPEASRPVFRGLRELRDELAARSTGVTLLKELSMGMSGDFEVAVEEGATIVRLGSALFRGLEPRGD